VDGCSSTFLLEAATEWNWTKEETLAELAKKGGFRGTYKQAAVE
jgi:AMMECR1 domain-containing protein